MNYHHRPAAQRSTWTFEEADWILSPSWGGLVDHHMRVIERQADTEGQRWYLIFDTTLTRGHADYEWVRAETLERNARLVQRVPVKQRPVIFQNCALCRGIPYSIPDRTDCESMQRFITSGQHKYRWSTQVWTPILAVAGAILLTYWQDEQKPKRRIHRRKRR